MLVQERGGRCRSIHRARSGKLRSQVCKRPRGAKLSCGGSKRIEDEYSGSSNSFSAFMGTIRNVKEEMSPPLLASTETTSSQAKRLALLQREYGRISHPLSGIEGRRIASSSPSTSMHQHRHPCPCHTETLVALSGSPFLFSPRDHRLGLASKDEERNDYERGSPVAEISSEEGCKCRPSTSKKGLLMRETTQNQTSCWYGIPW